MSTYHVYPLNDLVEHDTTSDECICVPRFELLTQADGSDGWILLHHSLDGREKRERPSPATGWAAQ